MCLIQHLKNDRGEMDVVCTQNARLFARLRDLGSSDHSCIYGATSDYVTDPATEKIGWVVATEKNMLASVEIGAGGRRRRQVGAERL
jgi:hypothetical protein